MSSITKQRVGKYTYLYESESFWDPVKKRPDNNKIRIGKIDALSGEPVYTKEYIDSIVLTGRSVEGMRVWDKSREVRGHIDSDRRSQDERIQDIISSVKDFGVVYFLRRLAEKLGLLDILREALPDMAG